MKINFLINSLYVIILMLTSIILSINFLYYQPFYQQIFGALILFGIAFLVNKLCYEKYRRKAFIGCLLLLTTISVFTYKKYSTSINEYCDVPLFNTPNTKTASTYKEGYNPIYYKDDHFEGFISFTNQEIFLYDLKMNSNKSIVIGGWNNGYYTNIMDVEYLDGTLYITKDNERSYTELITMNMNRLDIVNRNTYSGTITIFPLDNQMYIVRDSKIYQLSKDLNFTHETPIIEPVVDAKVYKNYYLIQQVTNINNKTQYELIVYTKAFEAVKTLITSPEQMMLSESETGELYVSLYKEKQSQAGKLYDLFFNVYDAHFNLVNEYLIEKDTSTSNYLISVNQYNGMNYVKYYLMFNHLIYSLTVVYDSEFIKQHNCLFIDHRVQTNASPENIFFIDNKMYVTNYDQIYEMKPSDYFKSEQTLTYTKPFTSILFYVAIVNYAVLWIDGVSKRKVSHL